MKLLSEILIDRIERGDGWMVLTTDECDKREGCTMPLGHAGVCQGVDSRPDRSDDNHHW